MAQHWLEEDMAFMRGASTADVEHAAQAVQARLESLLDESVQLRGDILQIEKTIYECQATEEQTVGLMQELGAAQAARTAMKAEYRQLNIRLAHILAFQHQQRADDMADLGTRFGQL